MHADSEFSGGDGSENNPYIIKTVADLNQLSTDSNNRNTYSGKYFKMVNDIDFNGSEFVPMYYFSGIFDGGGHIIKNIEVIQPGPNLYCIGLFAIIKNGTINNLGIENANMNSFKSIMELKDGLHCGVLCGYVYNNSSISNCFVKNSKVNLLNEDISDELKSYISLNVGGLAGIIPSKSEDHTSYIKNCYVENIDIKIGDASLFKYCHSALFIGQNNNGSINSCHSSGIIDDKNKFYGFSCLGSNSTNVNCYYDSTTSGVTGKTGAKTTSQMTGPDSLTNMTLGDAFRTTAESYPILKAFDTKINSVNFADGSTNYEFNSGEVVEPLKIKLNLSNTLNQQNQNDKIALYLDDSTEPIIEPSTETELSISADILNNLSIGEHKISARIIDYDNMPLTYNDSLTITSKQPPIPEVNSIIVSPTSHSKSKGLTSFTATLTGENFSRAYKVSLKFTNKSNSDETTIDCGNFSGNDTNSETINITGDNLDKIKNLSVGKYKIEALIESL